MSCKLTAEGLERLKEKKKELRRKRKELNQNPERIKSHGTNNGHILSATERSRIDQRIRDIDRMINNAEIVSEDEIDEEVVSIGCKVKLCFASGYEDIYVVGVSDPHRSNKISLEAPLACIVGKKKGDIVTFKVDKREREVKIANITK